LSHAGIVMLAACVVYGAVLLTSNTLTASEKLCTPQLDDSARG
jgi:hypothetical protein